MNEQGIPRSVFEGALKRALVTLAVQEGILPTLHDEAANQELYQRLAVFIDLGLEAAGVKMAPRPAELRGTETSQTAHGGPQDASDKMLH